MFYKVNYPQVYRYHKVIITGDAFVSPPSRLPCCGQTRGERQQQGVLFRNKFESLLDLAVHLCVLFFDMFATLQCQISGGILREK